MGVGFAFPAFLLLAVITIAPLLALVVLSFTDYELGATDTAFVGLAQFQQGARATRSSAAR